MPRNGSAQFLNFTYTANSLCIHDGEQHEAVCHVFVLMGLSIPVCASGTDADIAEIKAHDKAQQEREVQYQAEEANRKRQEAEITKKMNAQTANAVRPQLGKAAEGKSDEEVIRMYEKKGRARRQRSATG